MGLIVGHLRRVQEVDKQHLAVEQLDDQRNEVNRARDEKQSYRPPRSALR